MESRNIGIEHWDESALHQPAAVTRHTSVDELGDGSLSREELHRLIEFFRLLDRWDRQGVVQ